MYTEIGMHIDIINNYLKQSTGGDVHGDETAGNY